MNIKCWTYEYPKPSPPTFVGGVGIGDFEIVFSAVDNSLNVPPEYYGRKTKIQNIRLFEISSLGIMWFNSTIHAKPYPF